MTAHTLTAQPTGSRVKTLVAPALVLVLLSPLIGEVLSGATRLSYLFAYVPEVMMWGCGTLLIRELTRRWGGNWTTMLPLALALSVAEEFVVQQTSLAPLPQLGVREVFERAWGVNWFYFMFMLGFESVTITLVPVQITELIFPDRRKEPWLSRIGLVVAAVVFVIGAVLAWFLWVRIARIKVFHMPDYHPPMAAILAGVVAIIGLIVIGYLLPRTPGAGSHRAPSPWLVLPVTLVLGFPWYILMVLVFVPRPFPLWIPISGTIAWAAMTFVLLHRWASGQGWGEMHEWALSFGVLIVTMAAGFLGSNYWPKIDVIFKIVLNVATVIAMIGLASRIRRRAFA